MKNILTNLVVLFLLFISNNGISQNIDTNTIIEYNIYADSLSKNVSYNKGLNGTACTAEVIDQCGISFTTSNYGESNVGNGDGDIVCTGFLFFW